MIRYLYAIYDNQANEIVGGIHLHAADAAAIRMYGDVINAGNNMVAQHVIDHDLWKLGTLDMETGKLYGTETDAGLPVCILTGESWLTVNRPAPVAADA